MRVNYLISLCAFMLIAGCAAKPAVKDAKIAEVEVLKRTKEFEKSLMANDYEKSWNIRSDYFKSIFSKNDYFDYLNGNDYLLDYYKVDYSVMNLVVTGERAKVTMKLHKQMDKAGPTTEHIVYNYWVFENGGWYLKERGMTATKVGW